MFDWIPLPLYSPIYYHVVLLFVIILYIQTKTSVIHSKSTISKTQFMGVLLFGFVLLYMGLRPISGQYFGDMSTYNNILAYYAEGGALRTNKDVSFHRFMKFSSSIMSSGTFFFMCAIFYMVPLYIISKKWFKEYWFYAFLMLVGSFSFWAYGTNGIRNGIATSFFLMALSREKKIFQLFWLYLAVSFHSAMILPVVAFVSTWFYNHNKVYFYFWLLCIPLSLALGGFLENFFASMMEDKRSDYFTIEGVYEDQFSQTGFRWDFLLYSAAGVYAGWYYIYKMKIKDNLYLKLFNIYLFANGFWILVIRANFSNRFAYLSWFLLALVIIYPWLKFNFTKNQYQKMGIITLAYFGFTYLMNVIVY